MKRTLMMGVAAGALLAGINLASAQGAMEQKQQPAASGGANVEQKAGSGGAAQKGSAGADVKAQSPAGDAKAQAQGQDNLKGTTGQGQQKAQDAQKGDNKAMDNKAQDNKAQNTQSQSKPDASKSGATAQGDKSGQATTGQGAGGGAKAANLNTEQKTKIRETVLRGGNAPRVTNVNFSVSVGTVIPATVHFAPLPPVLVEIFPEWRGYDYVIVEERIVIIEPRTRKIVTVLVV